MENIDIKPSVKSKLARGKYLVPNAVTLASMFCGFLSIIYSTSGRYEKAVIAIILSIILDGLDGRVARRLNATSKFGLEFDSFSDALSFGAAPAILMYNWCFKVQADEFGVIITFLYLLAAACRLVRFNISPPSLTGFTGLPTPGAAGMVAAVVNLAPKAEPSDFLLWTGSILMPLLSYLMVSNLEFFSIKKLRMSEINPITKLFLGGLIALIWYKTQIGLLILAGFYCFSGLYKKILSLRTTSK